MTAARAHTLRLPPRWFVRSAWVLHRALYAPTGGRFGLWRPAAGGRLGTLCLAPRAERGRLRAWFRAVPGRGADLDAPAARRSRETAVFVSAPRPATGVTEEP
jgi:hypothetical protein